MNAMLPRPRFWAETALQLKTRSSMLGELMVFLLLYVIATMAQGFLTAIPMTAWMMTTQSDKLLSAISAGQSPQTIVLKLMGELPDWVILVSLFSSAALGVAALVYCLKFQKRSPASMGLRGKALPECLLGFALGLGLLLAAFGLGSALGGFRLLEERPEASILSLLAALLGCLVRGTALELLLRGYLAPSLGGRYPVILALSMSTLLSVMLEPAGGLLDLATLNRLLLALLLGIWVIKRGSLWSACALHGAWLFATGFLFGFAPAGEHGGIRLLDVDADLYRPLLSGGQYGPEASLCVSLVLLAALAVILALKARDPAPDQTPPRRERPANFL